MTLEINKFILKKNHVNIVDNMFINDSTYNKINNDYLGYIEYLDIKVEIILGINQKNLDNHHVCLDYESTSLDNNVNKILAGHNIDDVFKKLHNLKVNDKIKIVTSNNKYVYNIDEIKIVDENDLDALKKESNLTLITCMINPHKRLIIKASLT